MFHNCRRHVKTFKLNVSSKVIVYNLSFRFGKVVTRSFCCYYSSVSACSQNLNLGQCFQDQDFWEHAHTHTFNILLGCAHTIVFFGDLPETSYITCIYIFQYVVYHFMKNVKNCSHYLSLTPQLRTHAVYSNWKPTFIK